MKLINDTCLNGKSLHDLLKFCKVDCRNIKKLLVRERKVIANQHSKNYGKCSHVGNNNYVVECSNSDEFSIVEVLVHEFEHLRQFTRGLQLCELKANKAEYKLNKRVA